MTWEKYYRNGSLASELEVGNQIHSLECQRKSYLCRMNTARSLDRRQRYAKRVNALTARIAALKLSK